MEAAANRDISQMVNEQEDLLRQHNDQLAQLATLMDEVLRVLQHLDLPRGVTSNDRRILYHESSQHISPFSRALRSTMPVCPSRTNDSIQMSWLSPSGLRGLV